ncbi:FMN-dependent NADH-azoreductase, partial [Enterococcus durans]|nr:FMN-dependent NADH-azoreductase [Enterococcus durans]
DIFNFIGLTDFESVYVEGQAYAPQNADVILNDALVKIENIAKTF